VDRPLENSVSHRVPTRGQRCRFNKTGPCCGIR
jgi:hypothetical protein